jgi:PAS domain-containing protein
VQVLPGGWLAQSAAFLTPLPIELERDAFIAGVKPIPMVAGVSATPAPRIERTRFCTRCGTTAAEPDAPGAPFGFDRVCGRCGMGVMLSAPLKALPGSGAALMVVTREGRISAVSEAAEDLVGEEPGLIGMPIGSTLSSDDGEETLSRQVARAAGGGREVGEALLTPVPQGGSRPTRLSARITNCGPPRAALLVLERVPV